MLHSPLGAPSLRPQVNRRDFLVRTALGTAPCAFWMFGVEPAAARADERSAITDQSKVDRDFLVQGEYEGEIDFGVPEKLGVQVIVLSAGKFHAVAYEQGLPGAGWHRMADNTEVDGETEDNLTILGDNNNPAAWRIRDGVLKMYTGGDKQREGELRRVVRKSPTLGSKPKDAVVLFDGSTLAQWEGGRMTADKILMPGATSKQKFRDFTLHLEFRNPYMPAAKPSERGGTSCSVANKYKIEIRDSFGLHPYGTPANRIDNDCGAITSFRNPDLNMCFPPLSWQTFDIDFTSARFDGAAKKKCARVTVRHNGVVIHENFELPHGNTGGPNEKPEPGPLHLDDNGCPVHFRNIWVIDKT